MSDVNDPGAGMNSEVSEGEFDVERELGAAMTDFVGRHEAPTYQASQFGKVPQSGRRNAVFSLAAAAVLAVAGGVVALTAQGSKPSGPAVQPVPSVTTSAPTTAPSTPDKTASVASDTDTIRALISGAELYENPVTRSKVDLPKIVALFKDQATFQTYWGADALATTCHAEADGAYANGPLITFFQGAHPATNTATVNISGGLVTSIDCVPANVGARAEDVSYYYGSLIAANNEKDPAAKRTKVTQAEQSYLYKTLRTDDNAGTAATCGLTAPPHSWFADDPGSGTVTDSWYVALDGNPRLVANFGEINGMTGAPNQIVTVTCL
jgi:hypothetical protein